MTVSDIVGNFTTGNYSKAILSGLKFFKKPKESPETKMLKKIVVQLDTLESKMNYRFDQVHEHLFSIEDNIISRLDIVDIKLDDISRQIEFTYTELSSQLSETKANVDFIIRQNENTQNLILEILREGNLDICKVPVEEFKKRTSEGLLNSFTDLNNFFIGQQCKSCIDALYSASRIELENNTIFEYSENNTTSTFNKNQPDKLCDFIYANLINDDQKTEPLDLFSLLFVPDNVITAANLTDSILLLPDSLKNNIESAYQDFELVDDNKLYRSHKAVLNFIDYTLTMLPFIELYDNGTLLNFENMASSPGLSKERALTIIRLFDNMDDLIDLTILQQSLMSGMGSFKAVEAYIASGEVSAENNEASIVLQDIFQYNPFFKKIIQAILLIKITVA